MKTVSIIIPAYNCEAYVEKCIDSVLNQTYEYTEIIAVNDGSTDGTLEVLHRFGDKIRVIHKQNGGAASARNRGIEAASGEYIMFVDSDDYIERQCISELMQNAALYNPDIIKTGLITELADGRQIKDMSQTEADFITKEEFPKKIYKYFMTGIKYNTVCGTLFKSDIIKNERFCTTMKTAEDAVFSMSAYTNARSMLYLPQCYYHYRRSSNSLTGGGLSLAEKYRCNFIMSCRITERLAEWGMDSGINRAAAMLRPVLLTADKIRRILRTR